MSTPSLSFRSPSEVSRTPSEMTIGGGGVGGGAQKIGKDVVAVAASPLVGTFGASFLFGGKKNEGGPEAKINALEREKHVRVLVCVCVRVCMCVCV